MAVRHVVMFRWSADADAEQRARVVKELQQLAQAVAHLGTLTVGTDLGLVDGNYDVTVSVDFADAAGYLTYATFPEHVRVIEDFIKPAISARAALQFELEG